MVKSAYSAAVILAFAATVSLTACLKDGSAETDRLSVGTPMPQFSVSGPEGAVSTSDLTEGRTLVVLFRSTCTDCQRELPKVEEAFREIGTESDVRFVAITKEDNYTTAVPEYWDEKGYTMPYYFDPGGPVFSAFRVTHIPSLYLFGSDGKVAFSAIETFDFGAEKLIELIDDLK